MKNKQTKAKYIEAVNMIRKQHILFIKKIKRNLKLLTWFMTTQNIKKYFQCFIFFYYILFIKKKKGLILTNIFLFMIIITLSVIG